MKQPETLSAPATLSALTREAQALAQAPAEASAPRRVIRVLPLTENEEEVARQMQICNACRYCEGFCAVFPAMTRRLEFGKADIHYLANLCHNCGACYHACQYAPPHDFGVNVPQAMRVRGQTYADYAGRRRWAPCTSATGSPWRWRWPPAWRCSCCWRWRATARCGTRRWRATSTRSSRTT